MYDELIRIIEEHLLKQEVVVVAISGHGGSGKSTLAEKLATHFEIASNQIVSSDGLHAKNYLQAKGLFDMHDWETITNILKHVRSCKRLQYIKRDDKEIESIVDVPRPRVVIIEGIRLLRPEILEYVDISVWIDCPLDVATARAKERNRQQRDTQAEIDLWDTKWAPESKRYFDQTSPHKIASFIYGDYK